ncbi:MAG: hypothetical protein R3B72_51010 [Polyangiaceae bacterium]
MTDVAAAGPNAVAVGAFDGTLDFGAGAMIQPAGMGAYVVKLDSSGAPLWSKNYGTAGFSATATSVAVDSVGDIFVLGDSGSSHVSDLGGTCTGFATPSYLAKLDGATGACIWNVGIDTGASLGVYGPTSVEVDTSGNVVFAVRGDQALEITTTGGVETGAAPAGFGAWLAKRDGATGSAIWTQVIDGAADEHLSDLSISPVDGAVAMAGYTDGTSVTFPGGQNVSFTQVPFGFDGFVAQFDGATGEMTWVNLAQSTDSTFVEALTTTNSGDVVAVWTANGSVDFGGGPITLDGVAIVTYSGLGAYQAARLFPTNGTGTLANPDLAVAPNGEVRMTAGLFGTVDLGTGPIVASTPSQYDVLVFSLDTSTGVVSWHSKSSAVGTAGQFPRIDVAADGATLVGGARPSVLTFGTASLPFNGGPRDSYVVKLAP